MGENIMHYEKFDCTPLGMYTSLVPFTISTRCLYLSFPGLLLDILVLRTSRLQTRACLPQHIHDAAVVILDGYLDCGPTVKA
jgi:hypothetical protein